jgi:hypothetical protein
MSYRIIHDQLAVLNFIDSLLDLQVGETYLLRLITRSKYVNHVKHDYDLDICTVDKTGIISAIRNFERKYYDSIQNNDLGVYLTLNPRGYHNCMKHIMIRFSMIVGEYDNQDPIKLAYKELRNSPSRLKYHDSDYDHIDQEAIKILASQVVNKDAYSILTTKSGIHIIVDVDKVNESVYPNWRKDLRQLPGYDEVSITGDNMIAIPGCNQFGFVPTLTKPTF